MNFFQRRNFLKKANLLELTPVRMHEHEVSENGNVVLLVEKFKNKKVAGFMLGRKSNYYRIKLDSIGSEFWNSIDGKSKIYSILSNLKDNLKETHQKAEDMEERLSRFITVLYDNRYITFTELLENKNT